MSITPKAIRRERGYYTWRAYEPSRPVGDMRDGGPGDPVERWYCRRHCNDECGRPGRRISAIRRLSRSRRGRS
jgi:hypothetical protein